MNSFTVVFLFFQACLVQNVFSQCIPGLRGGAGISNAGSGFSSGLAGIVPGALSSGYGYGGASFGGLGLGSGGLGGIGLGGVLGNSGGLAASPMGAFGGIGAGNVAVAGELPVAGNTAVIGQVPILGAVGFSGLVQAAGSVSINGRSGCGCVF